MNTLFKIVSLCILTLIPFLSFGHIRGNFNWLTGYVWYTICYFIFGNLIYKFKINPLLYHFVILISLIGYLYFLYLEDSNYYFPGIAPTVFLSGFLGYALGYFQISYRKTVITGLIAVFLLQVYGQYNLLPTYFFNKMKYHPSLVHLKEIKPALVFQDLDEKSVSPSFFKNKVVILDFWFTGCEACIIKHKEYEKIYNHFSKDTSVFIGTIVDGRYNTISSVKSFLSKHKFNFPTLYDPKGDFARKYKIGIDGYPVELRLDKKNKVYEVIYGAGLQELYFDDALKTIKQLTNDKI